MSSSIGVLTNAPRFSAYVASRPPSMLDPAALLRNSRIGDQLHLPSTCLVKTLMIALTKLYDQVLTLTPGRRRGTDLPGHHQQAGAGRHGWAFSARFSMRFMPRVAQIVMNTTFRMFPDSDAAKSKVPALCPNMPSADQIAFTPDHARDPFLMPTLKTGDPAPNFSSLSTDGTPLSLADFRGRKLVILLSHGRHPGCTGQACSLRDADADIAARGRRSSECLPRVSTHRRFGAKYNSASSPRRYRPGRRQAYGVAGSGLSGFCCGACSRPTSGYFHHRRGGLDCRRDRRPPTVPTMAPRCFVLL